MRQELSHIPTELGPNGTPLQMVHYSDTTYGCANNVPKNAVRQKKRS